MNTVIVSMSHPFSCCPIYCKLTGNMLAGAILSHLANLELHSSICEDSEGFIFDSDAVKKNLGLKVSEILNAIQILRDKKIIVCKKGKFFFCGFDSLKRCLDA